jgi:hypothetical protein
MKQIFTLLFLSLLPAAALAQQQQPASAVPYTRCSEKLVAYADWPKVQNPNFLLDITSVRGRLLRGC